MRSLAYPSLDEPEPSGVAAHEHRATASAQAKKTAAGALVASLLAPEQEPDSEALEQLAKVKTTAKRAGCAASAATVRPQTSHVLVGLLAVSAPGQVGAAPHGCTAMKHAMCWMCCRGTGNAVVGASHSGLHKGRTHGATKRAGSDADSDDLFEDIPRQAEPAKHKVGVQGPCCMSPTPATAIDCAMQLSFRTTAAPARGQMSSCAALQGPNPRQILMLSRVQEKRAAGKTRAAEAAGTAETGKPATAGRGKQDTGQAKPRKRPAQHVQSPAGSGAESGADEDSDERSDEWPGRKRPRAGSSPTSDAEVCRCCSRDALQHAAPHQPPDAVCWGRCVCLGPLAGTSQHPHA